VDRLDAFEASLTEIQTSVTAIKEHIAACPAMQPTKGRTAR
jgi:hypothetical protein